MGGGRQEAKLLKDAAETAKSASYVQKPLEDATETAKIAKAATHRKYSFIGFRLRVLAAQRANWSYSHAWHVGQTALVESLFWKLRC